MAPKPPPAGDAALREIAAALHAAGQDGISLDALARRSGVREDRVKSLMSGLEDRGVVDYCGGFAVGHRWHVLDLPQGPDAAAIAAILKEEQ